MTTTQLKRALLFRYVLNKYFDHYTEVETYILISIYIMNTQGKRCSCNTLFTYLSKIHRTPYKKKMLLIVKNFIEQGRIRVLGKGPGTNLVLTEYGKQYLIHLEKKMRGTKN